MSRKILVAAVMLFASCTPQTNGEVVRAPNVLLVDESLLGVDQSTLEARFGLACRVDQLPTGHQAMWSFLMNTVMDCNFPADVLTVRFDKDGRSQGYCMGTGCHEW